MKTLKIQNIPSSSGLIYHMVEQSPNVYVIVAIDENKNHATFDFKTAHEIGRDHPDFKNSKQATKFIHDNRDDFLEDWKLEFSSRNPKPMTKKKALEVFSFGSPIEICDALVSIASNKDEDWRWAQNQCLHFLHHPKAKVRSVAASSLVEIARLHKKLDHELVISKLKELQKESKENPLIEFAINDIEDIYTLPLSSFEEFMEDHADRLEAGDLKHIQEVESEFPYTSVVKWCYEEMDSGEVWCWDTFGPQHGECDHEFRDFPNRCCPIVSQESKKEIIEHCHKGVWKSFWLGKTSYDLGYQKFFFKHEADKHAFDIGIRAIH